MDIHEQYAIGKPIFEKIFALPAKDLKVTVNELLGKDDKYEDIFENGTVIKTTRDDEPDDLKISSWSSIEISPLGIYYKPEHGTGQKVFSFTKYVTI